MYDHETSSIHVSVPPPLYDLDMEVIECLPPELFSELNQIYGGKLVEFIAQSKGKSEKSRNSPCIPYHEVKGNFSCHISDAVLIFQSHDGLIFLATTGCSERPLASTFIPNMVQVENMVTSLLSFPCVLLWSFHHP